jgi:hypothetical protein
MSRIESIKDAMKTKAGQKLYKIIAAQFDRGLELIPRLQEVIGQSPNVLGSQAWCEQMVFEILSSKIN